MSAKLFKQFYLPRILILLGMLSLTLALLLGPGQDFGWAAPEQKPNIQTVPPRPTEEKPTPEPTAEPTPDTTPPGGNIPTDSPDDEPDDNDNGGDPEIVPQPKDEGDPDNPNIPDGGEDEPRGEVPADTPQTEDPAPTAEPTEPATPQEKEVTEEGADTAGAAGDNDLADLSLSKEIDILESTIGEVITYTIIVTNTGPSYVGNVGVQEFLPQKLGFKGAIPSQGSYDVSRHLWDIGTLDVNDVVTLSLVTLVSGDGLITNTAEITAADRVDPDSTPANNANLEDDRDSAVIFVPTLSASSGQAAAAQSNGGQTATTVQQSDNAAAFVPTTLAEPSPFSLTNSLLWLYALVLGIVFIAGGVFLVNRA